MLGIAYVVIAPSLLGYIFYNRAVELIGASRALAFMNVMPVFGAAMSILLLGEAFRAFHAAGTLLIALGIALAARR